MTQPNTTLLERIASELGTHMINVQIANLEAEGLVKMKQESDLIIEGMKNRILTLESDIKTLRSEIVEFREKEVTLEKKKR